MHNASTHPRQSLARQISGALFCVRLWVITGALLFFASTVRADPSKEYGIKAAFLYNFTQFVDWPTNSFADANAPLTIGILGNDPFGDALDEIVRGEKANGHPLVVKRFQAGEPITDCHILFISQSEAKRINEILEDLKGRCVLTVGETDGFAQSGGMIRFVTEKNKIRLRINVDAAHAVNLSLSSRLLRLAEIVGTQKE
jgi:hypothetical protein